MSVPFFIVIALLSGASSAVPGQDQAIAIKEDKPRLLARARITPDSAIRLARARIPAGTIQSAEIEMEHGRLIYSFDLKTAGRPGIDEVNVDAGTGQVLPIEHEGPKAEAGARAADSAKAMRKP